MELGMWMVVCPSHRKGTGWQNQSHLCACAAFWVTGCHSYQSFPFLWVIKWQFTDLSYTPPVWNCTCDQMSAHFFFRYTELLTKTSCQVLFLTTLFTAHIKANTRWNSFDHKFLVSNSHTWSSSFPDSFVNVLGCTGFSLWPDALLLFSLTSPFSVFWFTLGNHRRKIIITPPSGYCDSE